MNDCTRPPRRGAARALALGLALSAAPAPAQDERRDLADYLSSLAGDDRRPAVSATFLQPFLSYVTRMHTTIALNTEATYDWTRGAAPSLST